MIKVVARVPGVPGISPSLKNVIKCGSNDKVTRLVSKKVYSCKGIEQRLRNDNTKCRLSRYQEKSRSVETEKS